MSKLVDLNSEWAAAIGKAFVAFGAIEHVTFICLRELPRDRIQRSIKSFRLGHRISLLLELLEAKDGAPYTNLSAKLARANELAKIRNLIAHNPLVMDVFQLRDGTLFTREFISHIHEDKHITLAEVQEFASEAEALAADLYHCSLEVFREHGKSSGT